MYSVLIVDDEKYVRLWIKSCINWQEQGFEIVGEAMNGHDALGKIEVLHPKLVISDMNMPELNGINLMEYSRERYPDILFIVLSGYAEFEYVRSAVKNNAVDYLLKPVKAEDLIKVLNSAKNKLDHIREKRLKDIKSIKAMDENLELRREKILLNLLDGYILTREEVLDKTKHLKIQKVGSYYNVISIRLDEKYIFNESIEDMSMDLYKYSIINMASEVFTNYSITNYFLARKNEVVGILNCDYWNEDYLNNIVNISRELIGYINKYLKISVILGVGNATEDIMYINASYEEAKRAFNLKVLYGNNQVLTYEDIFSEFDSEMRNASVEKAKKYIAENLNNGISLTDIADYVHITPNYFCALFKNETNETLFDYITNLRIERAIILMEDQYLKTYEIGQKVGYRDPKYFSRVFKKATGLSPANYRKRLGKS